MLNVNIDPLTSALGALKKVVYHVLRIIKYFYKKKKAEYFASLMTKILKEQEKRLY